jgi:hypothetical protein
MHRVPIAAFIFFLGAAASLVADEEPRNNEGVVWWPSRNIKDRILKEIDQFGQDVKTKLGPEILAHKPYIGVDGAFAPTLEPRTVEQKIDHMLVSLKKQADHDNEEFLPEILGIRRGAYASGSDLLRAPVGGVTFNPGFVDSTTFSLSRPNWSSSEKITFKVSWDMVDGRFRNNWDDNDVDEVYEVQLNATLVLGIALTIKNNGKLTVIDHSVSEPIVTGWRTSLVASEAKLIPMGKTKKRTEK